MKRTVQLRVVNPKREGVSQSTGQPWTSQDVVVAWPEGLPDGTAAENLLSVTLRNEQQEMFEHCQYKVGDTLEMDFQFYTYNRGTYVNNGVRATIMHNA